MINAPFYNSKYNAITCRVSAIRVAAVGGLVYAYSDTVQERIVPSTGATTTSRT